MQEFPRESLPPFAFAGHGDDVRNHLSLVRSVVDALEGGRYPSSFVVADLAAAAVYPATPPRTVTEPGAERKVIDWRVRQVMEEGISGAQIGVPNREGEDNAI